MSPSIVLIAGKNSKSYPQLGNCVKLFTAAVASMVMLSAPQVVSRLEMLA